MGENVTSCGRKYGVLVREPDAGNPPVRFDEGDVETGLRQGYLGTVRRKGRTTDKPNLRLPRHISI